MATFKTFNRVATLPADEGVAEYVVPQPLVFFNPHKGVDTQLGLKDLPRDFAAKIINLRLLNGRLIQRGGVQTFGAATTGGKVPCLVADIRGVSSAPRVLRINSTNVEYKTTVADWTAMSPDTWVNGEFVSIAAWGANVVFLPARLVPSTSPKPVLVEAIGSTPTATIITAAPADFSVLSVFGNRVILSRQLGQLTRIQWSVKNDSNDWSGVGSGFEDLQSASSTIDEVMGIVPQTVESAVVVRMQSIWTMSTTGFVDAPFRFNRLVADLGTYARFTVRPSPIGTIFLGHDDVYAIAGGQPRAIGNPVIREEMKTWDTSRLFEFWGVWHPGIRRYLLGVQTDSVAGKNVIWEYDPVGSSWTKREYRFRFRSFWPVESVLTAQPNLQGLYFCLEGADKFAAHEDDSFTQSIDDTGSTREDAIELRTGIVVHSNPNEDVEVTEVKLEYETDDFQIIEFEYSVDGGATWLAYSTKTIAATSRPDIVTAVRTVTAETLQFRVRSTILGNGIKMGRLTLMASRGAEVR